MKSKRSKLTTKPTKPPSCPKCGSTRAVPILYGEPIEEAVVMAKRGQIAIGGCCVFEGQPEWSCRACGWEWFDRRHRARRELERLFAGVDPEEG